MAKVTKEALLEMIATTETLRDLGNIMHMLPDCRDITVLEHVNIVNKIQERNEFLRQKRAIVRLKPDELKYYIDVYAFYTTYPDKQKLKDFAKSVQSSVQFDMIFEYFNGDQNELMAKIMAVTDYLHTNSDNLTYHYALNVAIYDDLCKHLKKLITEILERTDTEEVRNLIMALEKDISITNSRYGFMSEHSGILQGHYQVAVKKYAQLSNNYMLQDYLHRVSAPLGMPTRRINRMMFN